MGTFGCGICNDNLGKLVEALGACVEALVEERKILGSEVQVGGGIAVFGLQGFREFAAGDVEVQIGSPIGSPSGPTANIAANVVLISSLVILVVMPVVEVAREPPLPVGAGANKDPGDPVDASGPGVDGFTSHLVSRSLGVGFVVCSVVSHTFVDAARSRRISRVCNAFTSLSQTELTCLNFST